MASKAQQKVIWSGYVIGVLPCSLLLFSGAMKLIQPAGLADNFAKMGWPANYALPLGVVELACTLLYLIPRTAYLGAILLTGYMGGAIATHARLGEPFFVQFALGVMLWVGLYLRDARLRSLAPITKWHD